MRLILGESWWACIGVATIGMLSFSDEAMAQLPVDGGTIEMVAVGTNDLSKVVGGAAGFGGNNINLSSGGVSVEFEVRLSGWNENSPCQLCLGYQIDLIGNKATRYSVSSSIVGAPDVVLACDGACASDADFITAGNVIDTTRSDFMFAGVGFFPVPPVARLGFYRLSSAGANMTGVTVEAGCPLGNQVAADPAYGGTYVFDVPAGAKGVYKGQLHPLGTVFTNQNAVCYFPTTLGAPSITVLTGRCCHNVGTVSAGCTDNETLFECTGQSIDFGSFMCNTAQHPGGGSCVSGAEFGEACADSLCPICAGNPNLDCNVNGSPDDCDIALGISSDCNGNGIPDECEPDCNGNGVTDSCDITNGTSQDCNGNAIPDECDLSAMTSPDCNGNGSPDECDIAQGISSDCNSNGIPDKCEPDCNRNGIADSCDLSNGTSPDCNNNTIPDECDISDCFGFSSCGDCNANGVPDGCDISAGTSFDTDLNGIPDECEIWDNGAANNNWSSPTNWLSDSVPVAGNQVVIRGDLAPANVDLNVPATIDSLSLSNNATLNVTGAAGENLTITGAGGLVMSGSELGTPQAKIFVANARVISVPNGPVILNATALYEALPAATNVSAALNAAALNAAAVGIREGFPPGTMNLSDAMSVTTTGDFTMRYQPDGRPFPPAPCAPLLSSSLLGGAIDRPKLRLTGTSVLTISGNWIFQGGANVSVAPSASVNVGGNVVNQATVCPGEIDLSAATITMGNTPPLANISLLPVAQQFEVAGVNNGPSQSGFSGNVAVGTLIVAAGADVSFVDQFDNNADGLTDALYVGNLVFEAGSTITIDTGKVYYGTLTDNAASVTLVGGGMLTGIPGFILPPAHAGAPHDLPKQKYISIDASVNGAKPLAIKIKETTTGKVMWAGAPFNGPDVSNISALCNSPLICSDAAAPSCACTGLANGDPCGMGGSCNLFDWSMFSVLHLTGCIIQPFGVYEITFVDDPLGAAVSSAALQASATCAWGDIQVDVVPPIVCDVGIGDIVLGINIVTTGTLVPKTHGDVQGNVMDGELGIADIVAIINSVTASGTPPGYLDITNCP